VNAATPRAIRRVVTGHNDDGKAIIVSDAPVPAVMRPPTRPGFSMNELWVTTTMPAPIDASGEPTERTYSLEPPACGTVFRICGYPPDASFVGELDRAAAARAFADVGSSAAFVADAPHPLMHRTETVDYAIVIAGEITLVLDHSETTLFPGDVAIQRGTNHAWSNRTDQNALVAFVLIDGKRTCA